MNQYVLYKIQKGVFMNKIKIKDLTIQQMVETCHKHQNECCLNCPLYPICACTPYEINIKHDLEKEIDV